MATVPTSQITQGACRGGGRRRREGVTWNTEFHSRHLSKSRHLDLELSCAPSDVFASRHPAVHNEVFPLLVLPSAERKWKSDCQVHNCCPRGHHTNLHPVSKAIRPSVILTLLHLQARFSMNCWLTKICWTTEFRSEVR